MAKIQKIDVSQRRCAWSTFRTISKPDPIGEYHYSNGWGCVEIYVDTRQFHDSTDLYCKYGGYLYHRRYEGKTYTENGLKRLAIKLILDVKKRRFKPRKKA